MFCICGDNNSDDNRKSKKKKLNLNIETKSKNASSGETQKNFIVNNLNTVEEGKKLRSSSKLTFQN